MLPKSIAIQNGILISYSLKDKHIPSRMILFIQIVGEVSAKIIEGL
jgi:hypothetical protein